MKMSDKRPDERPREKLAKYGPGKLSDYELLVAIIGSGDGHAGVDKIARDVCKLIVAKGSDLTLEDLMTVRGMGLAKSVKFIAAFELWRR